MPSAAYGWAQPVVRRLCELDHRNIRFCLEPDRPTLHYVALCIRGWARSSNRLGGAEWLAARLARQGRRSLLDEIWGCDLGSPRLLSRCCGGVWRAKGYDQLAAVLSDANRRAAFARLSKIRAREVAILASAPLTLVHHNAIEVAVRHGLPMTLYVLAGVRKQAPTLTEREVLARLARVGSASDFADMVHEALLDVALPEPPWQGSPTLRPVRTLRELRATAEKFNNCLASAERALRVLTGDLAIYVIDTPTASACAGLRRDQVLHSWRLNEIKGVKNARPPPTLLKSVKVAFAAAGFPYLPKGPLGFVFEY
jgi:hypothetical protein